uniref:Uncharacterized protein n=1 Tax=Ditylenchus dipsaci TaxID=166011 RepID=A0A915CME5_9BILA
MQRSISTPSSKQPQHYFLLHNQQSAEAYTSSSSNSSFNELLPPENGPIFNRLYSNGSSNNSSRELAPFPVDPKQDRRREVSIESTPSFTASNDRKRTKRRKWKGRLIGNSFLKTKQEANNNSTSLLSFMMPEGSYSSTSCSSFNSELVLPQHNNIPWMQSSSNSFVQFKSFPLEEKYLREFKKRKSWCLKCSTLILILAIMLVLMAMLFLFVNSSIKPHKWRGTPNLASFGLKKDRIENIKVNTTSQYASSPSPFDQLVKQDLNQQLWISQSLMELFDGTNIAESLKWIASSVHVAGTHEQLKLIDQLEEEYQNLGFEVTSYEYDNVMLSYPDYQNPNTIDVWDKNTGSSNTFCSKITKKFVFEDEWSHFQWAGRKIRAEEAIEQQKDSRALVWWNAYSANGSALGQVVYANYGTRRITTI